MQLRHPLLDRIKGYYCFSYLNQRYRLSNAKGLSNPLLIKGIHFSPAFSFKYLTTSLTVNSFSASSSEISVANSSSIAITNSIALSESAPKSSINLASGTTAEGSIHICSSMSFSAILSEISLSYNYLLNFPFERINKCTFLFYLFIYCSNSFTHIPILPSLFSIIRIYYI